MHAVQTKTQQAVKVTTTPHNAVFIRTLLRAAAEAGAGVQAAVEVATQGTPDNDPAAALAAYTFTLTGADADLADEVLALNAAPVEAYGKVYRTEAAVAAALAARQAPGLPCGPVDAALAWLAAPPQHRAYLPVTAAHVAAAQARLAAVRATPGVWATPAAPLLEAYLTPGELPQALVAALG